MEVAKKVENLAIQITQLDLEENRQLIRLVPNLIELFKEAEKELQTIDEEFLLRRLAQAEQELAAGKKFTTLEELQAKYQ